MEAPNNLREQLAALLNGDELTGAVADLTGDLTGRRGRSETPAESSVPETDRNDRSDRTAEGEPARGRFRLGGRYKAKAVERLFRVSDDQRQALDAAGFPRAASVEVEGIGMLVDDLTRLMLDDYFLVLAFADVPPKARPKARGSRR